MLLVAQWRVRCPGRASGAGFEPVRACKLAPNDHKAVQNWPGLHLPSLRLGNKNYNLYLVFGWFPAELGPETRLNGSGSKSNAERTQN